MRPLDLQSRLPCGERALLFRLSSKSHPGLKHCDRRTGYAYCPRCIAQQSFVHVCWEWTFPCLLHCMVHGDALRLGCLTCGEPNPLSLGPDPATQVILAGAAIPVWSTAHRSPASAAAPLSLSSPTWLLYVALHRKLLCLAKPLPTSSAALSMTCSSCSLGTQTHSTYLGRGTERHLCRCLDKKCSRQLQSSF